MFKFSVSREDILKPLELISGPAPTGDDKNPIVKNVFMSVYKITESDKSNLNESFKDADYALLLKCTDTEIEMSTIIPIFSLCDVEVGETTVNADTLKTIVKSLPVAETLNFEMNGNCVHLTSTNNDFVLASQPANQFPSIDTSIASYELRIDAQVLLDLMKTTAFSIAQENYRTYLKGMRFQFDEKTVSVCTADGHRLSLNKGDLISKVNLDPDNQTDRFIFPKKGVTELIKLIEQIKPVDKTVTLTLSKNSLKTIIGDVTLISKLLDCKFPDVFTLLSNLDISIVVNKEDFMQSLRRVSIVSAKTNAVEVYIENRKLILISRNSIREEAKETIVPVETTDAIYQTGINSAYLIDICKVIPNKLIKISMSQSCRNALIEPVCSEDDPMNYSRYIVSRRIIG